MNRRITLISLGEDDPLTRLIVGDPSTGAILLHLLMCKEEEKDHSIRSLCKALDITSNSVIQRRLEWLEGHGVIVRTQGDKWTPTRIRLNYESKLFVKKSKAARKPEIVFDDDVETVNGMIQYFIDSNQNEHGRQFIPSKPGDQSKWVKACLQILNYEIYGQKVSMDIYRVVVDFLAKQYRQHLEGEEYMMQVTSLENMVFTPKGKTQCKFLTAFDKMNANKNKKVGIPSHTAANMRLLESQIPDPFVDDDEETRGITHDDPAPDAPSGGIRANRSEQATLEYLDRCLERSISRTSQGGVSQTDTDTYHQQFPQTSRIDKRLKWEL